MSDEATVQAIRARLEAREAFRAQGRVWLGEANDAELRTLLDALAQAGRERDAAVGLLVKTRDDAFDIGQLADSPDWLGYSGNAPGEVLVWEVIKELGKRGYAIYAAIEAVYPEGALPTQAEHDAAVAALDELAAWVGYGDWHHASPELARKVYAVLGKRDYLPRYTWDVDAPADDA